MGDNQSTQKGKSQPEKSQQPGAQQTIVVAQAPNYSKEDVARCISEFSGAEGEHVGKFIGQIKAVKETFPINEMDLKLLIIGKLTGPAKDWFDSKPTHITMNVKQLTTELTRIYGNRAQTSQLQQEFLNLKWRWRENEKFYDYYQEKIKLAANFSFPEHIIVKHLIDGIDNPVWEQQAKSYNIQKTSVLLETMENAIHEYTSGAPSNFSRQAMKKPADAKQKKGNQLYSGSNVSKELEQQRKRSDKQCTVCKKQGHTSDKCFFNKGAKPKEDVEQLKTNLAKGLKELSNKIASVDLEPKPNHNQKPVKKGQQKNCEPNSKSNKEKDSKTLLCRNCKRPGHTSDVCQFPTVPDDVCYNCGSSEHKRNQCPYLQKQNTSANPKNKTDKKVQLLFNVE